MDYALKTKHLTSFDIKSVSITHRPFKHLTYIFKTFVFRNCINHIVHLMIYLNNLEAAPRKRTFFQKQAMCTQQREMFSMQL